MGPQSNKTDAPCKKWKSGHRHTENDMRLTKPGGGRQKACSWSELYMGTWAWFPLILWPSTTWVRSSPGPILLSSLPFGCHQHQTAYHSPHSHHAVLPGKSMLVLPTDREALLFPSEPDPGPKTQQDSTVWLELMNKWTLWAPELGPLLISYVALLSSSGFSFLSSKDKQSPPC